jgi:hypothetical protein
VRGSSTQHGTRSISEPTPIPKQFRLQQWRRTVPGFAEREQIDAHGRYRETVEDQRGGIISQSFALKETRMRREICILRAMDSGATASGGETIAPNTKPAGHASPISQWAAAALLLS